LGRAWQSQAWSGKARQSKAIILLRRFIMTKIQVTIEGLSPLLMNRVTENIEIKISSGTSKASVGEKGSPREQAKPKAYMDNKGYLYIPGPNIFACIIQAGTFHKINKKQVTTQKSSIVPAGILLEELVCPLNTKNFEIDSRSVVIPATGGRIMCHRPRLDKWRTNFTLAVDESIFTLGFVRTLVEDAGKNVGLGDFRLEKKGPFGKFGIVSWEILKEKTKKAA
jgi:hypothetical protein